MQNIKVTLWGIKNAFTYAPTLFIFYILTQFLRSTLVVYTTVLLGNIVSDIQVILTEAGEFAEIIPKLVLYGILNIILWLAVELQWRFKDDYLPLRASVGATKHLVYMSRHIPLRKYDDAEFCDRYDRFQNGIHSLPQFLMLLITIAMTIYSFVLSSIALAQIHYAFVIILIVFFAFEMFSVRTHADLRDEIRKEITPFNRRASYTEGMFFGIYNRETRLYGLKDHYINQWASDKRVISEKELKCNKKISRSHSFLQFLRDGICPLFMIALAFVFVGKGMLLVGSIYTVWQLSRSTLSHSTSMTGIIVNCIAQGKHIKETHKFYQETKEADKNQNAPEVTPDYSAPALQMHDVSFSYFPGKNVLQNIQLSIQKGEIVALLGENGSGKSTLIKLLLGIYSPNSGYVNVFGHSAALSEAYIKNHIGITFQDFCTYPFTLRENVGFGNVAELYCDEKIESALHLAQADAILEKAASLNRMLGRNLDENGIELSGGEWQRIALARAYFSESDIMIFDEPAAKLDPVAEEKQFTTIIQQARESGKTVILVSHRVGFARMADKILYLKEGKITEHGTHSELLAKNGEYKKMFEAQREMYAVKEEEK